MHIPKFADWKKSQKINEKKQTWAEFATKNKIDQKIADKILKKLDSNATDAECYKYVKFLVKDDKLVKKIASFWQMNESNNDEEIMNALKSKSIDDVIKMGFSKSDVLRVNSILMKKIGGNAKDGDRFGDDPQSKQYFDRTIKNTSRKVGESFIQFCKAYKVNATQADADELGNDVSREYFKEYFNIPADADENPQYKRDKDFDDKKLNFIKINESSTDFDLLVTFATKDITEDNFENGQDGDTRTSDIDGFEGLYDSFETLCKNLGFPSDPSKWYCIDDRIIYSQLENANGDLVTETDAEYEAWKKGEIKLYAADYDFSIKFVSKEKTKSSEIEEKLGIVE